MNALRYVLKHGEPLPRLRFVPIMTSNDLVLGRVSDMTESSRMISPDLITYLLKSNGEASRSQSRVSRAACY